MQRPSGRLDVSFVYIAPAPILTRLEGLYNWMTSGVEVFGGMLILRGIATADFPTGLADPQMHPGIPKCQTFFTTIRAGYNFVEEIEMRTG